MHIDIHRDISVTVDCKGEEHKGLGKTWEIIFRIFWCTKQSSGVRGSPGASIYEILELELTKSFNPNRREIRVPEYRRGIKDPNTTQMATWARKAHSHVSEKFCNV